MNRIAAAIIAVPLMLSGCGTTPIPSQVATDVNLVATGLSAAITSIAQIPGVPAASVATLKADLAIIRKDAAQIAAATAAPTTSVIQEVTQTIQAVASVALPLLPNGSTLLPVFNAAVALVPPLLADVGIAGAAKAGAMDPDAARLVLRGAAH